MLPASIYPIEWSRSERGSYYWNGSGYRVAVNYHDRSGSWFVFIRNEALEPVYTAKFVPDVTSAKQIAVNALLNLIRETKTP